jgi:hypothetical protein
LLNGLDGVFLDEVYHFQDEKKLEYYMDLYRLIKAHGNNLILNTGINTTGELIMQVSDILMVEHNCRNFYQNSAGQRNYPSERDMGCSSNEPGSPALLRYEVNLYRAVHDTLEAWSAGIGWHYSTENYISLPEWFEQYTETLLTESNDITTL